MSSTFGWPDHRRWGWRRSSGFSCTLRLGQQFRSRSLHFFQLLAKTRGVCCNIIAGLFLIGRLFLKVLQRIWSILSQMCWDYNRLMCLDFLYFNLAIVSISRTVPDEARLFVIVGFEFLKISREVRSYSSLRYKCGVRRDLTSYFFSTFSIDPFFPTGRESSVASEEPRMINPLDSSSPLSS